MADIKNLNFKLLVDDNEFNKQIKVAMQTAKDLNAELSQLLGKMGSYRTINKATLEGIRNQEAARREAIRTREYENQQIARTERLEAQLNNTRRQGVAAGNDSAAAWVSSLGVLKSVIPLLSSYFSMQGAERLVSSLVRITGEFELQKTTLRAILSDMQVADNLFGQMKELAVVSPFQFKDLASYAKQLTAYSIPAKDLYQTTKMLADVSSGLGVDMQRLILAYGQVRSAAFLRGQEVRQFTEAGIPILAELAKQFEAVEGRAVSVGEVFDRISAREVSFEMVAKVFKDMTSEGGKFFNMQEIQAETLKGKISNLKDAYDIMLSSMGENFQKPIKGIVDTIREGMTHWRALAPIILSAASALAVLSGGLTIAILKQTILKKLVLTSSIAISAWAAGFAAAATAIFFVVRNLTEMNRILKEVNTKFKNAGDEAASLEKMTKAIEGAAEGTQKRRDAIEALNNKYREYLPNLIEEGDSNEVVRKKIDGVTNSIYARARAYAYEEGMRKIADKYGNRSDKAWEELVYEVAVNADVAKDAARAFVKNFKEALIREGKDASIWNVFSKEYYNFFGSWASKGENFGNVSVAVQNYNRALEKELSAAEELQSKIDDVFGNSVSYSSYAEIKAVNDIEQAYKDEKTAIDKLTISKDEYNKRIKELDLEKLQKFVELWSGGGNKVMLWNGKTIDSFTDPGKLKSAQDALDEASGKLNEWQTKVTKVLDNYSKKVQAGLSVQKDTQYLGYIDDLRKTYKALDQQILDTTKANTKENESLKEKKKAIEGIAKVLGISLKTISDGNKGGKSLEQIRTENEISALKLMWEWYEKFKELGKDDSYIRDILNRFFPGHEAVVESLDFKQALETQAEALKKYGKSTEKEVADLLNYIGKNGIEDIFNKDTKMGSLDKQIASFYFGDDPQGEGTAADIQRIFNEYKKKINDIENRKNDLLKELNRGGFDEEYVKRNTELVEKNAATGEEIALANANRQVEKLADDWVKNWAKVNGVQLDDWAHMTIWQLEDVQKALEGFYGEDGKVDITKLPDDIRDAFKDNPEGLERFRKAIEGFLGTKNSDGKYEGGLLGKLTTSLKDKTWKKIGFYAKELIELSDSLTELGEAAGAPSLAKLGRTLSTIGNTWKGISEGFKSGGARGAIVAGFKAIAVAAIEAAKRAIELRDAVEDVRREAELYNNEQRLAAGIETLFGTNFKQSLKNAKESLEVYKSLTEADKSSRRLTRGIGVDGYAGWTSISRVLQDLGYELYDAYGNLNAEGLQKVLDTYTNLKHKDREWIEDAIAHSEAYQQALEQLTDDTFSNLADTMADSLISAWEEFGDAGYNVAENMDEIFTDLATDIAKKLVSSFIIDNILNKYKSDVEALYNVMSMDGEEERVATMLGTLAENIKDEVGVAADFTNMLLGAFQDVGINFDSTSKSLGNAIAGITEDTADLLASYLNAIRADVSYSRSLLEGMSADSKVLLGLVPQNQSLEFYLMEIQANTANSAQATADILADLRSIIINNGNGQGLRAYVQ